MAEVPAVLQQWWLSFDQLKYLGGTFFSVFCWLQSQIHGQNTKKKKKIHCRLVHVGKHGFHYIDNRPKKQQNLFIQESQFCHSFAKNQFNFPVL